MRHSLDALTFQWILVEPMGHGYCTGGNGRQSIRARAFASMKHLALSRKDTSLLFFELLKRSRRMPSKDTAVLDCSLCWLTFTAVKYRSKYPLISDAEGLLYAMSSIFIAIKDTSLASGVSLVNWVSDSKTSCFTLFPSSNRVSSIPSEVR